MRNFVLLSGVLIAALLTACNTGSSGPPRTFGPEETAVLLPLDCDDQGDCIHGFAADEQLYNLLCLSPEVPESRIGDPFAVRSPDVEYPTSFGVIEVRRVSGAEPHIAVATHVEDAECRDLGETWVLASPFEDTTSPGFAEREAELLSLIDELSP